MKTTKKGKWLIYFAMLFCSMSLYAKKIEISGVVTDSMDRSPLIGANIYFKSLPGIGTTTDLNGKFTLSGAKGDTLCFVFLGYVTQEVVVKDNKPIHVALVASTERLEEVVVTALGSQRKISILGAITAAPQFDRMDAEEYGHMPDNRFKSVKDSPLSTFSIDVDAASYGNMRRYLNDGEIPPKDAVRVEELINYFCYDYPSPKGKDPVNFTLETGICPWNTKHRLVRIGMKAKEIETKDLPASNLVFLIDVSGSMGGANRIGLVKSSLKLLVNNLRKKDRVAIVVYSGAAGEKLPSTSGSDKQTIWDALSSLSTGGSTAGGAGIQLAYEIARKNFIKDGNNRVVLCTDGDFNVGISEPVQLESLIEMERKSGVFLTVLGYGMGNYKDNKMQVLAEKGNGNHAYIDNMQEANKVLVNEFGGTMYAVGKDVKLQVEFNPSKVQSYRLIGYESRLLANEDFNDDAKDAGEMGAGHTVTAFYEVVPVGVKGNIPGTVDELKYQKESPLKNSSPELLTVKLRYKDPQGDDSRMIEQSLIDSGGNNVSGDFYFASAVAMFGQLLRDSDFKGNANYDKVVSLAEKGLENDDQGYRREFIRLAKVAKGIQK